MEGVIIPVRKQNRDRDTQTHHMRTSCDDGGRNWSDESINQRMSRIASHHRKPRRVKEGSPPRNSEKAWPCWYLDFRLLSLQACERIHSCWWKSPPVCGNWLWQTLETNTMSTQLILVYGLRWNVLIIFSHILN